MDQDIITCFVIPLEYCPAPSPRDILFAERSSSRAIFLKDYLLETKPTVDFDSFWGRNGRFGEYEDILAEIRLPHHAVICSGMSISMKSKREPTPRGKEERKRTEL